MKKFLLFFLFFFKISFAHANLITIATINNTTITNVDIENEILIIKYLYTNIPKNSSELKKIALDNIVNDILISEEIKKNNIIYDKKIIDQKYKNLIIKIKEKFPDLTRNIEDQIYFKVKLQEEWSEFIKKKYLWKININLDEIESLLSKDINKFKTDEEILKYKEELILNEKNKKIQMYTLSHLNYLKKNALIKFY